MKLFIFFITLFSFTTSFSEEEWFKKSYWSDEENQYYVGVSSGQILLQKAKAEAYDDAIKEAIKHNFGFNQALIENFYGTLKETQIEQESFLKTEEIQLRGIIPGRQKVIEKDDKYIYYFEIIYPHKQILSEKDRLKNLKPSTSATNLYEMGQGIKGSFEFLTVPTNASLYLTPFEGTESILGTSNAKFILPLGKYHLTAIKRGYQPVTKEIIVSSSEMKLFEKLRPLTGTLELVITPNDAKVFIDSRPTSLYKLELFSNRTYSIRIEHDDYFSKQIEVVVSDNATTKLIENLTPKISKISFVTNPLESGIYLDNKLVGFSPFIDHELPMGTYHLKVKKLGFDDFEQTLTVMPNKVYPPQHISLQENSSKKSSNNKPVINHDKNLNENQSHQFYFGIGGALAKGPSKDANSTNLSFLKMSFEYLPFNHLGFECAYLTNKNTAAYKNATLKSDIKIYRLGVPIYFEGISSKSQQSLYLKPEYSIAQTNYDLKLNSTNETRSLAPHFQRGYGLSFGKKFFSSLERKNMASFGVNLEIGVQRYLPSNNMSGSTAPSIGIGIIIGF